MICQIHAFLGPTHMYKHYFEWKTHQDRRSAYLHFLEVLPSWSPSERQIIHATSLSHMIQFGPLIFSPVKGKGNKQFLKRNTGSNEMLGFFVSFPQKRNGIVFSSGVNYLHSDL